jgi:hypothetical protein
LKRLALDPIDLTLRELVIRATAYLLDNQGHRFQVNSQLDGWLLVRAAPRSS